MTVGTAWHWAWRRTAAAHLETRDWNGDFATDFQNGDQLFAGYSRTYEFLPRPSPIGAVILPVGGYDYETVRAGYNFGLQRNLSGNVLVEHGTFYNGHKTTLSLSKGRTRISGRLSVEPILSINRVDLLQGSFTSQLIASRVTYTMTPLMFVTGLIQYASDSNAAITNVRLRWEYSPGSELLVVYNEERDTLSPRFPGLRNRALIVKINRLFRF